MRPTRRELLAGLGAGATAGLAGCAGQLTAEGAAFAATEVSLSQAVQSDTGYSHHRTMSDTVVEEFERLGFSRTVEVTNVISEYDRAIELGLFGTRLQAAVFATMSTPKIEIFGRSFNPIADMDSVEVAELLQQRYDNIDNINEDGSFNADLTGETATVTRFTAEARLVEIGQSIDIYLFISQPVEVDGDFVLTVAAHPQLFGRKDDTVRQLVAGVDRE